METYPMSPKADVAFKVMFLQNHGVTTVDDGTDFVATKDLADALRSEEKQEKFVGTFRRLDVARKAIVYDEKGERIAALSLTD